MNKRRFNIKRKEEFNKKLAVQVVLSIVLVGAVIVTKQFDTNLSNQLMNTADEKISESIEPKEVGNSVLNFFTGVKNKIPFLAEENKEYAAPVNGRILQEYGLNKSDSGSYYNHGVDIISNVQSVRAIADGKVIQLGNNEKLANYMVVENDGRTFIYGKLSEGFVKEGDKISKGDIIGALSEENMLLHIEVWEDGESLNPAKLFEMNE